MEAIVALIESLGFPFACVIAMGFFIYQIWNKQSNILQKQIEEMSEANSRREERLYQQIDKFNATLENFNTTLVKIDTRLETLEKVISGNDISNISNK